MMIMMMMMWADDKIVGFAADADSDKDSRAFSCKSLYCQIQTGASSSVFHACLLAPSEICSA